MEAKLFGAGSDLGVHIDGARLGPAQLLNDVKNYCLGDIFSIAQDNSIEKSRNLSDRRKNEYEVNDFNEQLYKTLIENAKEAFPITIGGDSSISIPSALASTKKCENLGMIWISANPSFNTFKTTTSGNIHDLSLAAITGNENHELVTFHDGKKIDPYKTVVVGIRNIDHDLKDELRYAGVTTFSVNDIKEKGVETVMSEAFRIASIKTDAIHICFSLDLFDPDIAPGVSTPQFDGLTEEEGMKINELIIKNLKNVIAYDLVEFNPLRDQGRKTEQIAVNLLVQMIKSVQNKGKKYN